VSVEIKLQNEQKAGKSAEIVSSKKPKIEDCRLA
jgi:hypothetical protein